MKMKDAVSVASMVSLFCLGAVTRAETGASASDFAVAGAERIVIGSRTTLETLIQNDGRSFSAVVFSDDGARLVYAINNYNGTNTNGERAVVNTIIVRDAATFRILDTFTWIAPPSQPLKVVSIAWSPKLDRILCIANSSGYGSAIAVIDLTTKKLTSVPIEGIWPGYGHKCKWRTDTDVYVFYTGGSSPRDLIFNLDTLTTKDLAPDGEDDRVFIQNPLAPKRTPKGDSRKDRLAATREECFATPLDHKRARAITLTKGRYQTDMLAAIANKDGSFLRLLPEANEPPVQTVEGCYPAPDLRTIVMAQRHGNTGMAGSTNGLLVAFGMKLRDEPHTTFKVPFSMQQSLTPQEQADLSVCIQAKCAFRANVFGPRTNALTGRVVGPDKDHWKGEALFETIGAGSSLVRVTRENLPVSAGDVITNLGSDQLPYGTLTKSGGMSFGLGEDKWFILEPAD